MTDAEKREKVIRGLETCVQCMSSKDCDGCPYEGERTYAVPCGHVLMADALALLKEKEPRVMTWDDVLEFAELLDVGLGYSEKTPCYIEYFEPDQNYIKWGDAETIYGWVNVYITRDERRRTYNRNDRRGWRCWTSRPSPEQMRETPWEGDSDV